MGRMPLPAPPPPPPKCTPGIVCQRVKMESQIARSPARVLYCHGLLKSSEAVHYCLFDFERFLQSRLNWD